MIENQTTMEQNGENTDGNHEAKRNVKAVK